MINVKTIIITSGIIIYILLPFIYLAGLIYNLDGIGLKEQIWTIIKVLAIQIYGLSCIIYMIIRR